MPEKFRSRKFVIHNPNVTLMRTTRDENRAIGEWIGARLNQMNGPVRFLLPEGGVSMLDAPGQAVPRSGGRQRAVRGDRARPSGRAPSASVERVPANINDRLSSTAVVAAFHAMLAKLQRSA